MSCPLCTPPPDVSVQPDEIREAPAPEPRGPRFDAIGRRRATIHYATKERRRGPGSGGNGGNGGSTWRLRFPMLRLTGR
ncbi:MAG: hypothetical protein PVG07_16495, partial [Acidobacteriota bacterium]